MTLAQQQLQADYEKLKQDEADKSNKLQELMSVDITSLSEKLTNFTNSNFNSDINNTNDLDINRHHNIKNTFLQRCAKNSFDENNENKSYDEYFDYKRKYFDHDWSRFIPDYLDSTDSILDKKINNYHWSPTYSPKYHKNTLNTLTKNMTISKPYTHLSLFHLHTLHLHLFLSLTLILVTKCPQYVIVLCNSV